MLLDFICFIFLDLCFFSLTNFNTEHICLIKECFFDNIFRWLLFLCLLYLFFWLLREISKLLFVLILLFILLFTIIFLFVTFLLLRLYFMWGILLLFDLLILLFDSHSRLLLKWFIFSRQPTFNIYLNLLLNFLWLWLWLFGRCCC